MSTGDAAVARLWLDKGEQAAGATGAAEHRRTRASGWLLIWRGCGRHDLRQTVERFNEQHSCRARAFLPDLPYHAIWWRIGDPTNPGGHADAFATSLALHLRPETVRREL